MADIVILTAKFGNGHLSAALNIQKALQETYPNLSVELVDPFETNPRVYALLRRAYRFVANRTPLIWKGIFKLTDRTLFAEWSMARKADMRKVFAGLYETYHPKVVITTYLSYPYILTRHYGDCDKRPFRLLTVITDSVTINRTWITGESDLYLVADPLSASSLEKLGIPATRIVVTGFPTPPRFVELTDHGRLRAPLKRDPKGRLTILYLPNMGMRNLPAILRIIGSRPDVKLVLALGNHPHLVKRVQRLVPSLQCEVEVHGFIPDICYRMLDADMVITKAGGATVHEAIAAGCPLVISQVTPGQEEGNARLIESMGMGMVVRDERGLRKLLKFFSQVDYQVLEPMRQNLEKVRRVDAAYRIADLAAGIALSGQEEDTSPQPQPTP